MPGMDHSQMDHSGHDMAGMTMGDPNEPANGSGTSRLPGNEGGHHGLHIPVGDWTLMAHGYISSQYTSVSGPRGDDKFYVLSHAMLSATHDTGWGRVQLRATGSIEPFMRQNGYPSLFTTGEVAYGQPLIDRQHPHDLFIELSGRVDVNIAANSTVFLYGGPVAEPALGPSAFLHRKSAKYNPDPPITHHWFDSTHITFGVVTAGIATPHFQIETSAFRGREPDQRRFNIETPRLDSWSVRASWNPLPDWSLQASTGFLKAPEESHPGENEQRTTASIHFANQHGLSAMAGFALKDRRPGRALSAWLAEVNWDLSDRHTLFGRFENVNNDELFPEGDPFHEHPFRASKFQAGYAWNTPLGKSPFSLALGGAVAAYAKPAALDAFYGKNPISVTVFAKFSLGH